MTQHLSNHHTGTWTIQTQTSQYRIDLDARTLRRQPQSTPDTPPPANLRRDGETLILWHLTNCRIGEPMIALIQIRQDNTPTQRTTTPIQTITPENTTTQGPRPPTQ